MNEIVLAVQDLSKTYESVDTNVRRYKMYLWS